MKKKKKANKVGSGEIFPDFLRAGTITSKKKEAKENSFLIAPLV